MDSALLTANPCNDCGTETQPGEYYMVRDEVWAAAGMTQREVTTDPHQYLCISCLEARLGRQLHAGDFTDAPVNARNRDRRTSRLLDRLSRYTD